MKLYSRLGFFACILTMVIFSSCEEDDPVATPECEGIYEEEIALPGGNEVAPAPDYGNGTYRATPQNIAADGSQSPALSLDTITGVINISESIPGIKYYITFTSAESNFICEDSIIISGIDYLDTKIDEPNLADLNDEVNIITPILDADPSQNAPEGEFDIRGEASDQGLEIDNETGAINAVQTLLNLKERQELVEGIPYEFSFVYSFGDISQAEQSIVIYWFREEYSDDFEELFEIKSQFPRNARTMSPPPMVGVRAEL